MKISTILDHIDLGLLALPEFQRGYVWNRDQVRGLFDSLYKRHPIGGLLVWATSSQSAPFRGDKGLNSGIVNLLLDGQQRVTSLYGVVRGKKPKFFDGNEQAFSGLRFHLESETFAFYQPLKMHDDPLWIDITELMQNDSGGMSVFFNRIHEDPVHAVKIGEYMNRLSKLRGILDVDLHIEEVTGSAMTLDIVVDIFNRVNSGGTKLSKGDLALAKICVEWPEARNEMKRKLEEWQKAGYEFTLDWLLRSVNTIITGEAKFQFLHDRNKQEIEDGLRRAIKHIDNLLNLIASRLGLDHDRVLFGRYAIPVMVRYLEQKKEKMTEIERDKLLFWFIQAGMWGRFSGQTESFIDQDLELLEGPEGSLDKLLEKLRLWHGGLRVEAGHFGGWSLGARFYPVLYLLTRMGASLDWGKGIQLKASLLGSMNRLEVHHIFPKAVLYKHGYKRPEVNALANLCFQTKETNLEISDKLPEEYFPKFEEKNHGVLASQWIPQDPKLWRVENFLQFLEARKELLAQEMNTRLEELLHGDIRWLSGYETAAAIEETELGYELTEEQEEDIENINSWMEKNHLAKGIFGYEYPDPETGQTKGIFHLAWPEGVQKGLSQPIAILLNENGDLISMASQAGYRCFRSIEAFKRYVNAEILFEEAAS